MRILFFIIALAIIYPFVTNAQTAISLGPVINQTVVLDLMKYHQDPNRVIMSLHGGGAGTETIIKDRPLYIRTKTLITQVKKGHICEEACVALWLMGDIRRLEPGAALVFDRYQGADGPRVHKELVRTSIIDLLTQKEPELLDLLQDFGYLFPTDQRSEMIFFTFKKGGSWRLSLGAKTPF